MTIAIKTIEDFQKEFKEEIETLHFSPEECLVFFRSMRSFKRYKKEKGKDN